jgi:hypothetical protein
LLPTKEAVTTGKTVRKVALAHKVLPPENFRSVADDGDGNSGERVKMENRRSRIEDGRSRIDSPFTIP